MSWNLNDIVLTKMCAWVYRFMNKLLTSLAHKTCQLGNEKSKEEVDDAENDWLDAKRIIC